MYLECHYDPARSYDIGTYLWAIGCPVDGPEMDKIKSILRDGPLNMDLVQLGYECIELAFMAECAHGH
ncbi:hypothetical protein PP740_gp003 [Stenotrophomonas phage Philippe]|uniref:Uncharacterized protein n=1 Tax=Stenotrophomonas phage Philippe TaxID=2859655 RepID=A0AAE8BIF3_9CAUD|nr:hypothetical protein PP740_gp003 [Stenotrophomonas phage Philippe]QYW02202.1 hypothetical protein CPT_Philippe_003 [Stenotrophomonas phage Philippe]